MQVLNENKSGKVLISKGEIEVYIYHYLKKYFSNINCISVSLRKNELTIKIKEQSSLNIEVFSAIQKQTKLLLHTKFDMSVQNVNIILVG